MRVRLNGITSSGDGANENVVANQGLEVEIAMGHCLVPISVSSRHFALRYEVPKFLARGGHLCMAMLTIAVVYSATVVQYLSRAVY